MKVDLLISQEPFNRWLGKFLRQYTLGNPDIILQPIGNQGSRNDNELIDMFLDVMLREKVGGFVPTNALLDIFYAWYPEHSKYHSGFAPPRILLLQILERRYSHIKHKGEWCFSDVELVVTSPEEVKELIAATGDLLQYQLPNLPRPEYVPQSRREIPEEFIDGRRK